jgi:isochorismate hydrolase
MKEVYFSANTIREKSIEMLARIKPLRSRHETPFDPSRAVLLALDLQDYFLEPSSHAFVPSAPATLPGIRRLVRAFNDRDRPVIYTRHINNETDAGSMATWWGELITRDNPASELTAGIAPSAGVVVDKTQYDAFYDTGLEGQLNRAGAEQVVICGVMTHLCCETTARSAFVRGFDVFFTIDGTATYNEEFHAATLLNLSHGAAVPVLVDEMAAAFGGRHDG